MYEEAFSRLAQLYAELDDAVSSINLSCAGCGECCHFDVAEHVLYVSELERRYLRETSILPVAPDGGAALLEKGLRCPYQKNGGCLAREGRALGCRLHFCRWPEGNDEAAFCESWHDRLKRLHDDLGLEWRYAPLLPLQNPEKH